MCFLFFHDWEEIKDTGVYLYLRCKRCGKRKVEFPLDPVGYQPIDQKWLETGEWSEPPLTVPDGVFVSSVMPPNK